MVEDIENDQIKRERVYFEMPVLFQQLGVSGEDPSFIRWVIPDDTEREQS